jgi:WD40 repeat protein
VRSTVFAERGRLLVAATENGLLRTWRRTEAAFELTGERRVADNVECIEVSPDGRWVACASAPQQLVIWDLEHEHRRAGWTLPARTASLAWSPDGELLAVVGGIPGQLSVWEAKTGRRMWIANADVADPLVVRFSPDGKRLYTGGFDRCVREWDAATGSLRSEFKHSDAVQTLALSPDGDRLFAGDLNGNVLSWPL